MKMYEKKRDKQLGLKTKLMCKLGDKLAKSAVDPRNCWNAIIYELELPEELTKEMYHKK